MKPIPTILVVDDDNAVRYLVRWLLNRLCLPGKAQILEAVHGAQALQLVQAHGESTPHAPLLILLDLDMPVMDGLEFLEHLRGLPPTIRQAVTVVVVSATINLTKRESAIKLADIFISKPLESKGLTALLGHYLPGIMPPVVAESSES